MMDLGRFRDLVDAHGADFSLWPQADRVRAERLLATEPRARVYLQQAQWLDELIAREMASTPDRPGIEQQNDIVARVCDTLAARSLPPQRRGSLPWRWPRVLLNVDLAPAWPRIAALACAAGLGIGIGLFGADASLFERRGGGTATAAAETDLTGLGFDPEPLTGVTP